MSVTFEKDAASVTLPGPVPGSLMREVRRQAVGRSAGGMVYVYDKGVVTHEVTLTFESLSDVEKDALVAFFHDAAQGAQHSFTYTDSRGATYTARFVEPRLRLHKVAQNVWDVTTVLELDATGG